MARRADRWSRLLGAGRRLDPERRAAWAASLAGLEDHPRALAWVPTPTGVCVGSVGYLSFDDGGRWTNVGWHEIESGTWNAENSSLQWRIHATDSTTGRRGSVRLTVPGRLPELFRERVAASIVVEQFVPVSGDRGITVSGRRNLAHPSMALAWHATLGRGITWTTPGARQVADEALAELRREYDPGQSDLG